MGFTEGLDVYDKCPFCGKAFLRYDPMTGAVRYECEDCRKKGHKG